MTVLKGPIDHGILSLFAYFVP